MKIKTKIIVGTDYVLAAANQETINESWSLFSRILGRSKSALPATGRTLTAKIPNIAGLSKILSVPKNARLIDDALIAAEKSNVPQLVATKGPKGDPLVFYVRPNGGITARLTAAEASAVKAAGGKIPTTAGLAVQVGAKAPTARHAALVATAKVAQAGDEVLPGVIKTAQGFSTKLLTPTGSVVKTISITAPIKNMMSSFRNLIDDVIGWLRGARHTVKQAKQARLDALKAGKSPAEANKIFLDQLKAAGIDRGRIADLVKQARSLDRKAKKLGYNPQFIGGPFKHMRGTLGSKELSVLQKLFGLPKAIIKDLIRSPILWTTAVVGNVIGLLVYGFLGWGALKGAGEALGLIDAEDSKDFDIDLEPEATYIATLDNTEGSLLTDEEIEAIRESTQRSPKIISSKIKIIGNHISLINEIRSQEELNKEREKFEKKEGGPLSQQFNALSYMSPAKLTHMFGFLMSEGRLKALRNAAEVDYRAFKSEMDSIYRNLRWGDALNMLLVGLAAVTPIFTLISTILGKLFPNVGIGWFKLGMFDIEKYARDVAEEFMSLNEADWDLFVVPLTYQIMLEPGSNTPEGFSQKLIKYAGNKVDLQSYVRKPDAEEVIEKIENISDSELVSLASEVPGNEVKAMVLAARG